MEIINFILHIDAYLVDMITLFGPWSYVLLFAVVFAETGLVVAPFLPGDSLLFAAGALAGAGFFDVWKIYASLLAGAVLGDTVNYWIGHHLGKKVFSRENSRIFKKAYLEKTREFYGKYGGKTIIIARFMPIVRTFAPFVAGVGNMHYGTFMVYNISGAFIWVTSLVFAGYFFGFIPFVKENFEFVVVGIVVFSLLPMAFEYIKWKLGPALEKGRIKHATYREINEVLHEKHLND